jgi:hypothetical protein
MNLSPRSLIAISGSRIVCDLFMISG